MPNPDLIMTLGKVIVATAWADGHVSPAEINSLKDLTFQLPKITAIQWAELEMYIDSPVDEAERARLVDELRRQVSGPDDLALALSALENLVNADGQVTPEEQAVISEVKAALGSGGGLSRFVSKVLQRREKSLQNAPNREEHFEDYIKNKVYYKLQQRLPQQDIALNLPDDELRKLCLAGGIMAQVARIQPDISDGEFETVAATLRRGWGISPEAAAFVAEVAISDAATSVVKLRVAREFLKYFYTAESEKFLEVLFRVAAADGEISGRETEHIRKISRELLLSNKQFVAARKNAARKLAASSEN